MFFLIIFTIFFLVVLVSFVIGIIIIYHFKHFGIKNDKNIEYFLKVFRLGGGIILLFNLIFLLLLII